MGYKKRLERAFDGAPVLPLCDGKKYVLFSDCNRGDGTNNDNFLKNRHLYMIYGNHDIIKKRTSFTEEKCAFFSIVRPESACCRCLQELLFFKELSWNIQEVENDFI